MNRTHHQETMFKSPRRLSGLAALITAAFALTLLFPMGNSVGQDSFDGSGFGQSDDVFGGIQFGGLGEDQQESVIWSAKYFATGQNGRLDITATVGRSWHIYSTTQPPGGPLATELEIASPKSVSLTGKFKPNSPPTKSISDIYPGVTIEEHDGVVVWSAPIRLAAGFKEPITVDVKALLCQSSGSCMPSSEELIAKFAGPVSAADGNGSQKTQAVKSGDTAKGQVDGTIARTEQANGSTKSVDELLAESTAQPATFRDDDYEVTWTVGVSTSIAPGGRGQLIFKASPEPKFHVYKGVADDSPSSTNFVVVEKSGLLVGAPRTDQPIVSKSLFPSIPGLPDEPPVKFHSGQVAWSLPIQVPSDLEQGKHEVRGVVCYQACTNKSCMQPQAFQFVATVLVSDQTDQTIQPIKVTTTKFRAAIDQAAEIDWVDDLKAVKVPSAIKPDVSVDSDEPTTIPELSGGESGSSALGPESIAVATPQSVPSEGPKSIPDDAESVAAAGSNGAGPRASLPLILLMALGAGLILNLMPCVLPVLGLKIMSFVQQAGEDRKRIFSLNFAYVAGILTVFAGLTALAVFFSFGWGQQFTYFPVRLGLTVLIFALALSYLGLWELPTPRVATGEASQELQDKEGFTGAFFKGAFATILATPCSGPLLGVVLAYTISLPPIQTAAVMMTVGLGMSLPYIILGLFPATISFMPKPGNWMVTLKEFLAFLFLGTVAFFFNQFSDGDKLPVFVTLIGVWFGFWIIGKVPPWESIEKQIRGWSIGLAGAIGIGWFAFAYLSEAPPIPSDNGGGVEYIVDNHLRWEKYDEERLKQLQAEGKTVMLDFTAAWCSNCFYNTKFALDTEATSKMLNRLDGVAMLADWTDQDETIQSKLDELNSKSIPVLAIYPGKTPDQPIVLRDILSQATVLDALQEAGPSLTDRTAASPQRPAERFTSTAVAPRSDSPANQNH